MALSVRIIEAQLTAFDEKIFDNTEPFCEIQVGEQIKKTSYFKGPLSKASWNEVLLFARKSSRIKATIKDNAIFKNQDIGVGTFDISALYKRSSDPTVIPVEVYHKNECVGKVILELEYNVCS